ncbi:MAG: DEAD/DEAH box helicase family protein [Bacteroidetes bacterium]|jgi:type I restriction enzyme R subunit|nr:DEAD/DEAH box helicase family protein [Bacteroidota bacterium]
MNESQTQFELIEPALKKSQWNEYPSKIKKEFPITKGRLLGQGKRAQPLKADYVLQYNNRNLAIVEAKAKDKPYTEGVAQAIDYAKRLNIRFTYATNGNQIYEIDLLTNQQSEIEAYPTPEDLWKRTFKEEEDKNAVAKAWKERFFNIPFEDFSGTWQPRYYQENAITKTLEAIAEGKQRILLTLATGTGKTAISFQIAWKLFNARWNKVNAKQKDLKEEDKRSPRILFLADRNILANQAFNSYAKFDEDALVRITPKEIKKKGKVPKNGSIFFSIFQTFMSGKESQVGEHAKPYFGEYAKDFFDFIIVDECHRGGANDESTWRSILEHFDSAVQLGLTATPKRDVNVDTYDYFGEPIYTYSLKEGINDGFLTPFRVRQINTTIDDYRYDSDDEIIDGELDKEKTYKKKDFNKSIEIKQREAFLVDVFLKEISENHKTIVFCATQSHALMVRDLINQKVKSTNPEFCVRVTADDGKLGEQYLNQFQDNERLIPAVLTTSQKLSTGVDAPELRNIVLLRTVNSMVEFKQIVGRGTRLFDGKDYFTIFDFVKAHEHFQDPEWDGPPLERPTKRPKPPKEPDVETPGNINEPRPTYKMAKVKLGAFKEAEFDANIKTTFWDVDGKPIAMSQFIKNLFGELPKLFKDEDELIKIWSNPDTRRKLLDSLKEKGFTQSQLKELKRIIHAEDNDLFDVLSYIAYQNEMLPRFERAEKAKIELNSYSPEQQEFLNFILKQYVSSGEKELQIDKLKELLVLKYNSIGDAKAKLGDITKIRSTFIDFQSNLYKKTAV